jgi:phosphoglycolate phosphatase
MRNKRAIRLVIFDLDGTLVNAYKAVFESINFAMQAKGFPRISAHTVKRSVGWGDRHLITKFVGAENSAAVLEIYRRHHQTSLKNGTKLLPGALRILQDLKRNKYRVAIASNRPTKFSLIILKKLKIQKYFDYVLCADKLKKGKPHPEILRKILARFALSPREALYVGDMGIDLQAGRRAGVKTVAVVTGSCTRQELSDMKPHAIISRVDQVKRLLKAKNKIVKGKDR